MSSAPVTVEDADAGEFAATLRDARFVRVVASADGDSLAASGVLARALRRLDVPFQVRVDPLPTATAGDDETLVTVGTGGGDRSLADRPASVDAFEAARALGDDPDPVFALAGVVAAGVTPGAGDSAPLLEAATVERRPGVAAPTPDAADALAHSTLVRSPVSGDVDAAGETLAALGVPEDPSEDDRRRLASWLAIAASEPTPRAAEAVERALRPHATPDGPSATVEGLADLLDAVARERPGVGVALALGSTGVRESALEAWRTHARWAHAALSEATTGRYEGVVVARVDGDRPERLATVARLRRDFRDPEPVSLVIGDRAAAAAGVDDRDVGGALASAVTEFGGTSIGGRRRGTARFDGDVEVAEFIAAFREAL